jgi:hypothetical protein
MSQEPAKATVPYIQPRFATLDRTIRGGADSIDDLKSIHAFWDLATEAKQEH